MSRIAVYAMVVGAMALCGCGGEEAPAPPVETPAVNVQPEAEAPAEPAQPEPATPEPPKPSPFVTVRDKSFIDPQGNPIILHGINLGSKKRDEGYVSWHGPDEFAAMKEWGFNCIRLLICWDAVEPEPGVYDDEFLARIDERIKWAADNGIYVLLDMHQDLYGVKFGDGAPEWATLDDGKEHIHLGGTWSDAYLTSPAVQTAFDNFWANKPGPDGVSLQDHFAGAWRHVAERYADNTTVVGYDLLNEPFIGSTILMAQLSMVTEMSKALSEKRGEELPVDQVVQQWLDPKGRGELMSELKDMTVFAKAAAGAESLSQSFETKKLMPMFQRVANAIREVDTNHIVFLETSMFCNMGVLSAVEPLTLADGTRDPLQAYAPHGYDIVVDTASLADASLERIAFIFDQHAKTADRLNMPMLIGEWGAYYGSDEVVDIARFTMDQFKKHGASDTYWDFHKGVEKAAFFDVLRNP